MVDRPNKPSALASTPRLPPQAQVSTSDDNATITAVLPTGESVEVRLFGATVTSWKTATGEEKLWLSEAAVLDGSKAIRGGIPLVFPRFAQAPEHEPTVKLPQHGFARTSRWELLGKSTSEGSSSNVKLDFGLSSENLDAKTQSLWPYKFGLIYSVMLDPDSLNTTLVITNEGDEPFEFQALFHTYFKINDITSIEVAGLEGASYIDKVDELKTKTQQGPLTISSETDSIFQPTSGSEGPLVISEGGQPRLRIVRENLPHVVVWNPWADTAAGMADFGPNDGYKNMICVEPGTLKPWQKLEKGDTYEVAQTLTLL